MSPSPPSGAFALRAVGGAHAISRMKQVLSLKVSQHLTLTPQLQQSIRLLQPSTLEPGAEGSRPRTRTRFWSAWTSRPSVKTLAWSRPMRPSAWVIGCRKLLPNHSKTRFTGTDTAFDAEPAAAEADETLAGEGDGTAELRPDDSEWVPTPTAARHLCRQRRRNRLPHAWGHVSLQRPSVPPGTGMRLRQRMPQRCAS